MASTEQTFSSYDRKQGNAYASARRDYHPNLYKTVLDFHSATGGQNNVLVDVGTGPGNVARTLAQHFSTVVGLDPSQGMIQTAISLGGETMNAIPIRYEISTAEELGSNLSSPIESNSVDLITAANAAHWFDMPRFWESAARILRPGGSVILWMSGEVSAHPDMPNAEAVQAALDKHRFEYLRPYYARGNLLTRSRYRDLELPWTLAQPVSEFDESKFVRKEDNKEYYAGNSDIDMDTLERIMSTASPVTRWRQANPELVGTSKDVLAVLRREIEQLLQQAGVEKGHERVKGSVRGALLVVKKKI
ncbi:S-adenosyl-L-methionine-dependent methyltransferase [Aaosphaeria arxii CBS 175.79]|uniref:S-adenosyl-L-methionine-dependent methyltransferase n=1 Tax=Aaosphaeria arxii CBS 175.79 TaxID=1450172 RepID=A0A6A5XUE2_9PLEO|nr:S-adenosyl-L-methionine-dependent methyltransferase [Aaosphaeria arxii CBS 175.79]KAF2016822.1 S-adenosyl-L-methionine-dependent methyltransferase [Aaosphaeria arxii CBS 175.79]